MSFIGSVENIFTYENEPGHEIVFIFEGDFVNKEVYKKRSFSFKEENGEEFEAGWVKIQEFADKKAILYPEGLLDLLLTQFGMDKPE